MAEHLEEPAYAKATARQSPVKILRIHGARRWQMATVSEGRLSCGCADEKHLGTPCSCDTCVEDLERRSAMATASEVRLSCGCADEKHSGTPCSCATCAEGLTPEHKPMPCPLLPEQRPEAVRKQAYEAKEREMVELTNRAARIAKDVLVYQDKGSYQHEDVMGVAILTVKLYDELNANYGQEDAEWLLKHQDQIPAKFRNFYLPFPGTVWQDSDGDRRVPYLSWLGDEWVLVFDWLRSGWSSGNRLLCPCKSR